MSHCPGAFPYRFVAGDTLPELSGRFDGVDLTGGAVTMVLEQPDAAVVVIPATLTAPADGRFSIPWASGNLVVGRSRAQISATTAAGRVFSTPVFYLDVEESLA